MPLERIVNKKSLWQKNRCNDNNEKKPINFRPDKQISEISKLYMHLVFESIGKRHIYLQRDLSLILPSTPGVVSMLF